MGIEFKQENELYNKIDEENKLNVRLVNPSGRNYQGMVGGKIYQVPKADVDGNPGTTIVPLGVAKFLCGDPAMTNPSEINDMKRSIMDRQGKHYNPEIYYVRDDSLNPVSVEEFIPLRYLED